MTEEWLKEQGISNARLIGGVWCGTTDYLTTRGLLVGIDPLNCYQRRYCYQNRVEADAALAAYTDPDKHPGGMWIKVKGVYRGNPIDAMNPNWPDIKQWDKVAPE